MEETPKQLKSVKGIVDEIVAIFEREGLVFFPPDIGYGHKCEADLIVDAVRAIKSYPSFTTDAEKNREELFKRSLEKQEQPQTDKDREKLIAAIGETIGL